MSADQWKRPYFLYKFHGQPDCPFLRSFRFIPWRRNCKIRYFIVQLVSTCGLRVYMAHLVPELPPLSPSTFFYDVSCFSVIKHTDLSSWNFIHYFNLSAQRISTNRLSSKREAGLVCFNVRFRHWKLLIELTKTTRNAEGGKNIKKEKKKKENAERNANYKNEQ